MHELGSNLLGHPDPLVAAIADRLAHNVEQPLPTPIVAALCDKVSPRRLPTSRSCRTATASDTAAAVTAAFQRLQRDPRATGSVDLVLCVINSRRESFRALDLLRHLSTLRDAKLRQNSFRSLVEAAQAAGRRPPRRLQDRVQKVLRRLSAKGILSHTADGYAVSLEVVRAVADASTAPVDADASAKRSVSCGMIRERRACAAPKFLEGVAQ